MLAARRLPEVLRTVLDSGIEGACLMTADGSLLSSVSAHPGTAMTETTLGALSSSIMSNFSQGKSVIHLCTCDVEIHYNFW
jgi:hypothetical protein